MESTSATAALEGRYAALRACAEGLSSEELLDVIELAQREKDAASARQAVAHLSARDAHRQEDGTSVEVHHGLGHQRLDGPELAAPRLGCSVFVATNRILDAIRQMTRTPAVVDAMASGDLDEYRARVVTEETEFLSPESAAEVVDRVKDVWGQLTVGPLRQLLARTAAQVDPDAVAQEAEEERGAARIDPPHRRTRNRPLARGLPCRRRQRGVGCRDRTRPPTRARRQSRQPRTRPRRRHDGTHPRTQRRQSDRPRHPRRRRRTATRRHHRDARN